MKLFISPALSLVTCLLATPLFAAEWAYIANKDAASVSVVDIDRAEVVVTIPVGLQPTSIAVSKDGSRVFVLNGGDKTVSVIDTTDNSVITQFDLTYTFPEGSGELTGTEFVPAEIVTSPAGSANQVFAAGETYGLLATFDLSGSQLLEMSVANRIGEFPVTSGLDIIPTGTDLYLGTSSGVAKIGIRGRLTDFIEITPQGFVLTDDGSTLYGANTVPNIYAVDTTTLFVEEINIENLSFTPLDSPDVPTPMAVSPDGQTLYVIIDSLADFTDTPISLNSPAVAAIDIVNRSLLGVVAVGADPVGLDITPDGTRLVVPNHGDNTVTIINAESLVVLNTVAVGSAPRAYRHFIATTSDRVPPAGPGPDIWANNSDSTVTITADDPLSLNISLDASGLMGLDSDWWVAVKTPFAPPYDWFSYTLAGSWIPGISAVYQGPLFDLGAFPLSVPALPAGTYTFYFAIDTNRNGTLDMAELLFDQVSVTVTDPLPDTNLPPVADAGADLSLPEGEFGRLTGIFSDVDGQVVNWNWQQLNGPTTGSLVTVRWEGFFIAPYVTNDTPVTLRFTVTDNDGASSFDDVRVLIVDTASNSPPSVYAGADLLVDTGAEVQLSGQATDQQGVIISLDWTQTSGPAVSILNSDQVNASFTAPMVDEATTLIFRLTATDDDGDTAFDEVTIQVSKDSTQLLYNSTCINCHESGVAGAPNTGDTFDWTPRLAKGMDVLLQNTINGINAMPPRGACFTCSNEDFIALINYMATPSSGELGSE